MTRGPGTWAVKTHQQRPSQAMNGPASCAAAGTSADHYLLKLVKIMDVFYFTSAGSWCLDLKPFQICPQYPLPRNSTLGTKSPARDTVLLVSCHFQILLVYISENGNCKSAKGSAARAEAETHQVLVCIKLKLMRR